MAIEIESLTKLYQETAVLNCIDIQIDKGQMYGLLGPSGAGKSTLVSILSTLLVPTEGSARINGYDVCTQAKKVRRQIGTVFQELTLDDNLTVYESLSLYGALHRVKYDELPGRIDEALDMAVLWERCHDRIKTLSEGTKRMLQIAQAMLHYPKVLILDEPARGLDPQSRLYLWEYINNLRTQRGTTVFIAAKYMNEAEKFDRVSIIDEGDIIAEGTPEDLKNRMGGEIVEVATNDKVRLGKWLDLTFGINAEVTTRGLSFEVENAAAFLSGMMGKAPATIHEVSFKRPTLNDVLVKLTGKSIRDDMIARKTRGTKPTSLRKWYYEP
ncbi:MAG: ATP-binding cassette domain-containing protein [Candidatus Saccharibacteria bacterium]